jgi:acetyl esterase/lipase
MFKIGNIMTLLFFFLSVISLGFTLNVIYPRYHHAKLIVPSFIFGWLVGELAIHVVLVQLFLVFWFVLFGHVNGFLGAVGVVIFVGSWLTLAYHYFSGFKAKTLLDSIVIPYREASDLSSWSRHTELDLTRLLLPFSSWKSDEVEVIKNVVYREVDNFKLKLDIRHLKTKVENAPVLLQIHGGNWTHGYGSKNEQGMPLMAEMAKRGWVCVSTDYRLCPEAVFPDHIIDCKSALVWIKENIEQYGGNPDFIVVTGGSAGGHLSSLLALSSNEPSLQPDFEDKDTSVQGCVPYYGIYDLMDSKKLQTSLALEIEMRKRIIKQTKQENEALYQLMSPITHINKDAPPFLVIHGDKDSLTSLAHAQYFASSLDEISTNTVEFAEISGGQHAFDVFSSVRSDYVMFGVAERMCQWYRDYVALQKER